MDIKTPIINSLLDNINSEFEAYSLAVNLWKSMMDNADDELSIKLMGCKIRSEFLDNYTMLFLYVVENHDRAKEYIEIFRNILLFRGDIKNSILDYVDRYFYCV